MSASRTPHLAELRRKAADAGIERLRMLRREELVEQLRERGVEIAPSEPEPESKRERRERPSEREERGRKGRRRGRGRREEDEEEKDVATRPAAGILDITPRGHGFLRSAGLQAGDDDVYVSASQIRRCVLRPGDVVGGPAREPRRDERYPALVHVDQVNHDEPVEERPRFDDLTPGRPERQLGMDLEALDPDLRELVGEHPALTEVQAGERVLIRARPGSARFGLLRGIARALSSRLGPDVIVLLIDVPPEELAEWQQDGGEATVAALAADASPAAASRVARLALEHAKRRAESGADVVLIVDSLTRLAVFEQDVAGIKRLFGAGRTLAGEEAGSLTVIATTLADDEADRAVSTTESALVNLPATDA